MPSSYEKYLKEILIPEADLQHRRRRCRRMAGRVDPGVPGRPDRPRHRPPPLSLRRSVSR